MVIINDIKTIEENVYNYIGRCLEEDEIVVVSGYVSFDYYLPNGCKKLNWPKKTVVEIKYRLIYDSLSRIKDAYDNSDVEKLIVIVITEENIVNQVFRANNFLSGRNIEVITYTDFINKLPDEVKTSDGIKTNNNELEIDQKEGLIVKAREAFNNNKTSLFLGAGVSASAGIVTWDSLLEQLCIKKGLPKIDSDIDSVVKGRYIVDAYKEREQTIPDTFYYDMKDILYANVHSSKLIRSIAKLVNKGNIESVISYNYDNLVEQEIAKSKTCCSIYDKSRPIDNNSLHVYHVHGFLPQDGQWSPIVLGEKEYHKIYQESYNWGNVEQLHALCRNVCFFIGLSMKDPNLRRLIDISIEDSEIEPMHYAFLRRIEYDVPFMEKVMRGFGVNCIWYDKHEDLPKMLDSLTI